MEDLHRSLKFYRDGLGLRTEGVIGQEFEDGAVVFFRLDKRMTLALYPAASLSKDAKVDATKVRLGAVSIGHIVKSRSDVDAVMKDAKKAGAVVTDPPKDRFWGGYSGYFHDPDGHLWEIAWNPAWSVADWKRTVCACLAYSAIALTSCVRRDVASSGGTMDGLLAVQNISVSILCPPKAVYSFASSGENLPRWATGVGKTVHAVDGEWIADGPLGQVRVRFAATNDLGVLDHDIVLESGATVHNPMRVVPNGRGSTVIFTLLRQPGVTEQKFADDAKWVEKDLTILKGLLEKSP